MEKNTNNIEFEAKWLKPIKLFGAYVAAAIGVMTSLGPVQEMINGSLELVTISVYVFIGITPPLISFYLFHQKEINKNVHKFWKKIVIALNLLFVATVFLHGYKNPSIFTQNVKDTAGINALKNQDKAHVITEETFKTEIPIFRFRPKNLIEKGAEHDWLRGGISGLLIEDLSQSNLLTPVGLRAGNDRDRTYKAKHYNPYFVEGEFEITDRMYTITTLIKDCKYAKIQKEKKWEGPDLWVLIDSMAIFVHKAFTPAIKKETDYLDLPVKELTSKSLKALRYYYGTRDPQKAIEEDATFVLPYFDLIRSVTDEEDQKKYLHQLRTYRKKLSKQRRYEFTILQHQANHEYAKVQEVLDILAKKYPVIADDLYIRYGHSRNVKAYVKKIYSIYDKIPKIEYFAYYFFAAILNGEYKRIAPTFEKRTLNNFSDEKVFLWSMYLEIASGKAAKAAEKLYLFKLENPDWETAYKPLVTVFEEAIRMKNQASSKQTISKRFQGTYQCSTQNKIRDYRMHHHQLIEYSEAEGFRLLIPIGEALFLRVAPQITSNVFNQTTITNIEILKFLKDPSGPYYVVQNLMDVFDNVTGEPSDIQEFRKTDKD